MNKTKYVLKKYVSSSLFFMKRTSFMLAKLIVYFALLLILSVGVLFVFFLTVDSSSRMYYKASEPHPFEVVAKELTLKNSLDYLFVTIDNPQNSCLLDIEASGFSVINENEDNTVLSSSNYDAAIQIEFKPSSQSINEEREFNSFNLYKDNGQVDADDLLSNLNMDAPYVYSVNTNTDNETQSSILFLVMGQYMPRYASIYMSSNSSSISISNADMRDDHIRITSGDCIIHYDNGKSHQLDSDEILRFSGLRSINNTGDNVTVSTGLTPPIDDDTQDFETQVDILIWGSFLSNFSAVGAKGQFAQYQTAIPIEYQVYKQNVTLALNEEESSSIDVQINHSTLQNMEVGGEATNSRISGFNTAHTFRNWLHSNPYAIASSLFVAILGATNLLRTQDKEEMKGGKQKNSCKVKAMRRFRRKRRRRLVVKNSINAQSKRRNEFTYN